MTRINSPDASASRKQLWLLHMLTKEDTRDWELTMQEASDKISEIKGSEHKQDTRHSTSKRHWGIDTFIQTSNLGPMGLSNGKYGYCSVCYADMQIFDSDGLVRHYNSHKEAISLGLWGKR